MKKDNIKKVLLYTRPLAPPWDEGSKNLAFDLAKNCSSEDLQFQVLTTKDFAKKIEEKYPHINPEPIFPETTVETTPKLSAKIALLKRLFRKNLNANIVHFLFTPRSLTSLLLRMRLKNTKIKTVQTVSTISKKEVDDKKKTKKVFFADVIVAQSEHTKKNLKNAGIENVQVVYPGINLEKFSPQEKDPKLMNELGIEKDDFVVLFAGEYLRLKAIDDIVEAFKTIFEKESQSLASDETRKKTKLILACRIKCEEDKIKKAEVQKEFERAGFADKVIFIGTFPDMPKLFNLADTHIFPVRDMTGKFDIPLAVIEGMAVRKPVIISDILVLEEFVEHKKTGLVVKSAAPEKLATAVEFLRDNPEKREEIAQGGFEYVKENFNIKNISEKYKKIYNKLI